MVEKSIFNSENYDAIYDKIIEFNKLEISGSYPNNIELNEQGLPKYRYETSLVKIDLDKECESDIINETGFYIKKEQDIKKDLKSDDSIFSSKYGMTIDDMTPFGNEYRCSCGRTMMKINNGLLCDYCHTKVKYVSNDFSITGWIKLNEPYFMIHPNLYKELIAFIGKKNIDMILNPAVKINEDGFIVEKETSKTNPFAYLGMLGFKEQFFEIMGFYYNRFKNNANKMDLYNDIMNNKEKVFTHSIPVYTSQLRPYSIVKNRFSFEGNNALYNIIAGMAYQLNNDKIYSKGKTKSANTLMYDIQMKYMEIYADLEKIIAQKKGYVRSLNGGRYNFTARNVIIPDPNLEADQIILPYTTLIELLSLTIINILTKTNSPSEAYRIWDEARMIYNPSIKSLMDSIIQSQYIGIILNRNPSISPASVIQMHVVGIATDTYSCSVPLDILNSLGADFDGDTLNIMLIINDDFLVRAARLYNPRLAMQISYNDGMFNSKMSLQTDTVICLNSFSQLGIDNLNDQDIDLIQRCQDSKEETQTL